MQKQVRYAALCRLSFFCIVVLITAMSADEALAGREQDVNRLLNVSLEVQKDYEPIPAIMGMVIADQNASWMGAFGSSNLQTQTPVVEIIQASICSISTVFPATALLQFDLSL